MFFMPAVNELYSATEEGAYFNHSPISPLSPVGLKNALAFIAVPSSAHLLYEIAFPRIRSLGSTTAHLAYVSRGVALAALTRRLYIWDIAPVMLLLKATGISIKYLSGRKFEMHQLLDGSTSPEPLVAAPLNLIESVRISIQRKSDMVKR
jgi:fructose-1,6-bisphosphatase/inositol monophosphatase family enzyme